MGRQDSWSASQGSATGATGMDLKRLGGSGFCGGAVCVGRPEIHREGCEEGWQELHAWAKLQSTGRLSFQQDASPLCCGGSMSWEWCYSGGIRRCGLEVGVAFWRNYVTGSGL